MAVEGVDESGRLQEREPNGQVARGLGDLLLTNGPLVTPLAEFGNDAREQLDDDGARDVGHDPEAKDRESSQRPTREEVQEAEYAARSRLVLQGLDLGPADAGNGQVRA